MVMGDISAETELLVIGGGPGGYAAAFRAADLGMDVTLVTDEERLGGVCLMRGCIPSKALLHLAELLEMTEEAREMGIAFGDPDIDLDAVRSWKNQVVDQLVSGLEQMTDARGVRVENGWAHFAESNRVLLENSDLREIEFEHAIIATGSRPMPLPGVDFSDRIMASDGALDLPDVPERLLVVGGGYIGLEMGLVYAKLGSRVTLVEMMDRILPSVDEDLVGPLADAAQEWFEGLHFNVEVSDVKENGDGVEVSFEGDDAPGETSFDRVLVAVGREPNTGIDLDNTGVELDDNGFIVVDEQRRTADERIFAIGDVAGGTMLAHEAMHEGIVAVEAIAGEPAAFDARAVPAVVYTDPQIAWCGLTEQEAEADGREIEVARFPWRAAGRAVSMGATDGMTKLIMEPDSQRILGMGVVGRGAESLISEGVLAIEMGAVAYDLAHSIHPHPTLSETINEAAQLLRGHAIHLPPKRS